MEVPATAMRNIFGSSSRQRKVLGDYVNIEVRLRQGRNGPTEFFRTVDVPVVARPASVDPVILQAAVAGGDTAGVASITLPATFTRHDDPGRRGMGLRRRPGDLQPVADCTLGRADVRHDRARGESGDEQRDHGDLGAEHQGVRYLRQPWSDPLRGVALMAYFDTAIELLQPIYSAGEPTGRFRKHSTVNGREVSSSGAGGSRGRRQYGRPEPSLPGRANASGRGYDLVGENRGHGLRDRVHLGCPRSDRA